MQKHYKNLEMRIAKLEQWLRPPHSPGLIWDFIGATETQCARAG